MKTTKKKKREAESQIHEGVISWWSEWSELNGYSEGLLMHYPTEWINFVPSENRFAAKMDLLRKGYRKGTADLFLAIPRGASHGLWIELKTDIGNQSDAQVAFEEDITEQGFTYCLCRSKEEAEESIQGYLAEKSKDTDFEGYKGFEDLVKKVCHLTDEIYEGLWSPIVKSSLNLSEFNHRQREIIDDWFFLVRKASGKDFVRWLPLLEEMLILRESEGGRTYLDMLLDYLDSYYTPFAMCPELYGIREEKFFSYWDNYTDHCDILALYCFYKVIKSSCDGWTNFIPDKKTDLSSEEIQIINDIWQSNRHKFENFNCNEHDIKNDGPSVSYVTRSKWIRARQEKGIHCEYGLDGIFYDLIDRQPPWQKDTLNVYDAFEEIKLWSACLLASFKSTQWLDDIFTLKKSSSWDSCKEHAIHCLLRNSKQAMINAIKRDEACYGKDLTIDDAAEMIEEFFTPSFKEVHMKELW